MKALLFTVITMLMTMFGSVSAQTITIGTGTGYSSEYPYGMNCNYSTTQSIYTAEEMGGACTITSIAYNVAKAGALSTSSVKIYMGHRSSSYFSGSPEYVSDMILVFSGSPTLASATGWETLALQIPFVYNGTSNLVVVVAKQASRQTSAQYYYTSTSSTQCLDRSGVTVGYGDASSTSERYGGTSNRANVRFGTSKAFTQDGIIFGTVGDNAFVGGTTQSLGALTIPSTVTNEGKTYRVTSIGDNAFYGCSGLTSITIPSSLTSIESYAFYKCSGLTSITIPNSVTSIGYYAFGYCSGLKSITIPSSVTSIGSYAFYECSGLTSITIPGSVTSIGNFAFRYCTGITDVKIEDGTSILFLGSGDTSLFEDCPLESLYLGRNLFYPKVIYHSKDYTSSCAPFENKSKLKDVIISSSVTSIGSYAFCDCNGLTSITIPSSVTSIEDDAFTRCTSIKDVKIEDGASTLFLGCKINSSNSSYYYGLFKDCPIESLHLGRNLSYSTHSYKSSYPGYGAPFEYQTGLKDVTISSSVTSIGSSAFYGCTGLTSITIPSSVTSFGDYAFYG